MSDEQRSMLISAADEFFSKNIEPANALIEKDGISSDLVSRIGSQGFIGLLFPEDIGGSNVDAATYLLMLEEFARFSPSVALQIAVQNRIAFPLLSATEEGQDVLKAIAMGKKTAGIALSVSSMNKESVGNLKLEKSVLAGSKNYVLSPSSETIIALTDDKPTAIIATKTSLPVRKYHVLGFRGVGVGAATFDDAEHIILMRENGDQKMQKIFDNLDLDVAAIALGIAKGSMQKAMDYSRVRSTFGHLLKDYSPVAFSVSSMLEEVLRLSADLEHPMDFNAASRKHFKITAMELAIQASRQSIQTHGGYGYLQDFGVEKFYRDSTSLLAIFGEGYMDKRDLADQVYGEKSGFL
ncbi:MAG: acyl-CoA dehydrogenase family protein [Thermoplasmata archaeon]